VDFGVYLHIPFCAHRCDYCAFATWTDRHHLIGAYLDALGTDIARAVEAGMPAASSVFVGGGTPTQVPAEGLAAVLASIPTTPGAEVTVECNPDDVDAVTMAALAAGGVNRISLGMQSTVPSVLESLGRRHRPEHVQVAVAAVREAGIPQLNLDVIYGAAGETLEQWERTIRAAVALSPTHVSAYGLTVEPGTPLALQPERYPDDDRQADMYELADDVLTAAGLANYEVSNWAVPGYECRHNQLYWRQGDYVGFGSAAHSHRAGRRWWNVRTPERYIAAVVAGDPTEAAGETLDADTRRVEGLQLALRTREGIDAAAIDTDGLDDLVVVDGQRVVLTRRGRLLANEVSLRVR
jgi:oxygen-independent coproporphyrinogen-3 oxidase